MNWSYNSVRLCGDDCAILLLSSSSIQMPAKAKGSSDLSRNLNGRFVIEQDVIKITSLVVEKLQIGSAESPQDLSSTIRLQKSHTV